MKTETIATQKAQRVDRITSILNHHHHHPSKLIPILQDVQEEYKYLPEDVLTYIASSLGIPPANVYGVATFYSHFALEPKGKYLVKLCNGTACHVKESMPILEAIRSKLSLSEKKKTTDDMMFTVETVACLGACSIAPVVVVNEQVFGQMTPKRAEQIIDDILKEEESK